MANASRTEYFHGLLNRSEAEMVLRGEKDGSFLLRKSPRGGETYVISLTYQGECIHYSILTKKDAKTGVTMYSIQNGTTFHSLDDLIAHYRRSKGGLKVRLQFPVSNMPLGEDTGEGHYVTEIDWFHNDISRDEDSKRLTQGYHNLRCDGLFLIRKKEDRKYVLSLVKSARVYRYIILQDAVSGSYFISGRNKFQTLESFVEYHRFAPPEETGLQAKLSKACPKPPPLPPAEPVPLPGFPFDMDSPCDQEHFPQAPPNTMHQQLDVLKEKRKWLADYMEKYAKAEQQSEFKRIYWNYSTTGILPDLYINKSDVNICEQLGNGHFGSVCLGCCNILGEKKACAIKFLKGEDIVANKKELITEATVMQKLDHPHIIRLLGVCDSPSEILMILELAPLGPFKSFIDSKNDTTFPLDKVANIMTQVCYGMRYLESQNIVHRDLAARNILLVNEEFAKVSDFGMSKVLMQSENYYRSCQPGAWPLRWYSPEALNFYKFTTKCDVWSYGVTLWEAFTYGGRPYKGMKGQEILHMLDGGERLQCPQACPQEYYDLMLRCWTYNEEERPTFFEIAGIIDNLNIE